MSQLSPSQAPVSRASSRFQTKSTASGSQATASSDGEERRPARRHVVGRRDRPRRVEREHAVAPVGAEEQRRDDGGEEAEREDRELVVLGVRRQLEVVGVGRRPSRGTRRARPARPSARAPTRSAARARSSRRRRGRARARCARRRARSRGGAASGSCARRRSRGSRGRRSRRGPRRHGTLASAAPSARRRRRSRASAARARAGRAARPTRRSRRAARRSRRRRRCSSVSRLPSRRASNPRAASARGELRRALDDLDEHRLGLLGQAGDRAGAQHLPGAEHDDRVAGALDVAHQVRRDHDADPELAADAADELEHVAPPERVEAGGRLVEEREHRVVHERLRELDALLHPGRVRPHRPVALLEQADVAEQVRGAQRAPPRAAGR